ncbi:Hypothetical protein RG1141_PB01100 (plasmid) [Neorhizobium galegae bv. officinalis bv. officinalis str. HAMBI 1141]|uniref:Uncharacterized protein n=2 Tax=Neorhizobium galegae TaxID=399 RepID=A0A068TJH0_NEOGA|nr:Hypothetical protein RG1141_PB01100 [Neorhizobium galegae bv. officinalis bv. officinalis str. HAMBI 1141]
MTCSDKLIQMTAACMGGDLTKAAECRRRAEMRGCSTPGTAHACDTSEVRESIDWVFRDAGARQTYARGLQQGLEPVEAIIEAQQHNPRAMNQLRGCREFISAYLNKALAPPPSAADCSCVSVIPAGARYTISNSCPESFRISAEIVDAANTARRARIDVGSIEGGESKSVTAPAFTVPSIKSTTLFRGGQSQICPY